MKISFTVPIHSSLIIVFSNRSGVVTNESFRKIRAGLPIIDVHINDTCKFLWNLWYAASRSIFLSIFLFGISLAWITSCVGLIGGIICRSVSEGFPSEVCF